MGRRSPHRRRADDGSRLAATQRAAVLRAIEALLVGAVGGGLGWLTGELVGLAVPAAVAGGANGLVSGAGRIYDWRSMRGPASLVADSTWGLPLVAGALLLHAINALLPGSDYRSDLSKRAGYHVYAAGAFVRRGFVWTVGNVVSNARPFDARRRTMLARHEGLHVFQHRAFGPLFPIGYLAWIVLGGVAGTFVWLVRGGSWWRTVDTIAYFDNPFETWAYRRDQRWPHPAADPDLSWGRNRLE